MNFKETYHIPIQNYLTQEEYTFVRADQVEETQAVLDQIVSICNEESVYNWLFKKKRKGAPYTEEDAKGFLQWAHEGWKKKTHFVFFVLAPNNAIAAACDIKSDVHIDAEIGYWASSRHRGIMTNALHALIACAQEAEIQSLVAFPDKENTPSQKLLERTGFLQTDEVPANYPSHYTYRRDM